jgi:hypothetical protein
MLLGLPESLNGRVSCVQVKPGAIPKSAPALPTSISIGCKNSLEANTLAYLSVDKEVNNVVSSPVTFHCKPFQPKNVNAEEPIFLLTSFIKIITFFWTSGQSYKNVGVIYGLV